jgi:hypothetical protein
MRIPALRFIKTPFGSAAKFLSYRKVLSGIRRRGMSRTLVLLGLILVAIGLLWPWIGWLRLGRLPGDIVFVRPGFTLYIPITSAILVSIALSVILWLVNR